MSILHPKVLLVDDDRNIIQAFREFLKKDHCDMIAAMNYEAALFYLHEEKNIVLVITELRLGEDSGISFLKKMRSVHVDLPVIVMTGYPDLITQDDLIALFVEYVFTKPADLSALRKAAQKYVRINV